MAAMWSARLVADSRRGISERSLPQHRHSELERPIEQGERVLLSLRCVVQPVEQYAHVIDPEDGRRSPREDTAARHALGVLQELLYERDVAISKIERLHAERDLRRRTERVHEGGADELLVGSEKLQLRLDEREQLLLEWRAPQARTGADRGDGVIDFELEEMERDILLRLEVIEDRALGELRLPGDLPRRGLIEALRLEERERGVDDALAHGFLLARPRTAPTSRRGPRLPTRGGVSATPRFLCGGCRHGALWS